MPLLFKAFWIISFFRMTPIACTAVSSGHIAERYSLLHHSPHHVTGHASEGNTPAIIIVCIPLIPLKVAVASVAYGFVAKNWSIFIVI